MEKFFYAEKINNEVKIKGDFRARFGNKINGEGISAEWIWDGEKLVVTNDRYGFYPLYFAEDNEKIAVSPSLMKLLELGFSQKFDDSAIAVFLRFSSFIGEDTPFKSIRALPPRTVLTWQNGKSNIASEGIIINKKLKISRREAQAVYAELVQRSVEKTLLKDEKIALPLSGGRDSRHILFALEKARRKPDVCLTAVPLLPATGEDVKIAQHLCEVLKVEHRIVEQYESRFETELRKNNLLGLSAFEHGWYLPLADLAKDNWNIVYDGIGGDILTEDAFFDEDYLRLFEEEKFSELADKLLEKEAYLPLMLTKEYYARFSREKAVNRLITELVRHKNAPNPFSSFYFWNRTRRCVALCPFRLLEYSTTVITPYLDTELFDFLSALAGEIFLGNDFHTETIAHAFPQYADIPYENLNAEPLWNNEDLSRFGREIMNFSRTSASRRLTKRRFFISRGLRTVFDKNYSKNIAYFGDLAVLLMRLERLPHSIHENLNGAIVKKDVSESLLKMPA